MSDERWLSRDERQRYATEWSDPRPSPGDMEAMLDHAEAADELIAELAAMLQWHTDDDECYFDHHGGCQAHDPNEGEHECMNAQSVRLLARVDALTKDTA